MCQFFKKRCSTDSAVTSGKHRDQEIDRETALKTSQNEKNNRFPFTPPSTKPCNQKCHSQKRQNSPQRSRNYNHIFSLAPLISFKHDKSLGNFPVRSAFKSDNQTGTFTCKSTRRKICPFISNTIKISAPNRCAKVTGHFACISVNVIYCITCTLCKKICIGETGRRLADRFHEQLRDVEKNDTDAFKPVARHFNLPNYSHHNMTICRLSLHHRNTESRKNLSSGYRRHQ